MSDVRDSGINACGTVEALASLLFRKPFLNAHGLLAGADLSSLRESKDFALLVAQQEFCAKKTLWFLVDRVMEC
eukprot:1142352-Pelagomonas_calceolata.AAC.1